MEKPFDLLKLLEFLHRTLAFTDKVKDILKLDCDEADYCLKSWTAEVCPREEIAKDISCTCPKRENEAEEIATGISKALLQTQQLREKLSLNVKERNYKCLDMYESSKQAGNKRQTSIRNANDENVCSKKDITETTGSTDKKIGNKIVQKNSNNKSIMKEIYKGDKKLIVRPAKLTGTKNFLAINKRNIKNMVEAKQSVNAKSNNPAVQTKLVKFGERHSVASTSELKELIQKVSTDDSINFNEHCANCPLHGDINSESNKRSLTNMTVVESFNFTDIPHEIIKSLKIYHTYLNIQHSEKAFNEKRQKVINKFLTEFDKTDGIVRKKLSHKDHITVPLNKFMSLFQTTCSENMERSDLLNIKAKYAEFCNLWNIGEADEFSTKNFKDYALGAPDITISNTIGCMSNGIWNCSFAKSFEGMLKVYCLRYTNKNQLLQFFDTIQRLQHVRYHEDLIKIIETDVLSAFKNCFDHTQFEYAKIYKMISILHQGLNPKIPVLVRTDK